MRGVTLSVWFGKQKTAVVCLFLVAATLVVFWPVIHCDFINYDDPGYFTSNPRVQTGLKVDNVVWALSAGEAHNWHPLTWLSLMLDATLYGNSAAGPHFSNLLIHAANTVLLFLLLRRLTAANGRSAFVAALFALHPLHVESVAWVAERKDVLSAFFGLSSLIFYHRFATGRAGMGKANAGAKSRPAFSFRITGPDYFISLALFACALMSKPMLVTLPFLLLLLDWWPLQRFNRAAWRPAGLMMLFEKIPFFVLATGSCIVTFIVQEKTGAVANLAKIPMGLRIENAFVSYARYLGKAFWPVDLAVPYPYPGQWETATVIASVALVLGISVVALRLYRFPFISTGWFWFLGTLIPVIGLVQVGAQAMADRYTYLPLTGVFILFAWGMNTIFNRQKWGPIFLILMASVILFACAARTRSQLKYWQNSETLFSHTLAVTKGNDVAYSNLGAYLSSRGRLPEAMLCFEAALKTAPHDDDLLFNYATACYNTGLLALQDGRLDESITQFRKSLELYPDLKQAHNNLGNALSAKGRTPEAVVEFQKALKIDPAYVDAYDNWGITLLQTGQADEAMTRFQKALEIQPHNADTLNDLGAALLQKNRPDEAITCFKTAIGFQPDYVNAYEGLADAFAEKGDLSEAQQFYQTVLKYRPGDEHATMNLLKLNGGKN